MTTPGLREHVAEPANLWIRHSFSRWPVSGDDEVWCDLAAGGLPPSTAGSLPAAANAAEGVRSVTDVVYVPPLAADCMHLFRSIGEAAAEAGVPLLIQIVGTIPAGGSSLRELAAPGLADLPSNQVVAVDLLDTLVRHAAALREELRERRQPSLPFEPAPLQGVTVVWPLVSDWTDQPGLLEPAMARLAAAGTRRVVPRALQLDARERRLLAERLQSAWPEAFDALFHGDDSRPDHSAFWCAAEAAGLEHRLPRPLPALPLPSRLRRSRELAGHLIELGDAAATHGDVYYRAARFLDRNEVDIDAAAREGNLGVLPWLEDPARVAVEAWLAKHGGE
ncbi:MAG: hypothetical protein J4F98_07515 [Acidobacteria bacterium]|nr:hypothetical protein [Acidobacteriota bacterium]